MRVLVRSALLLVLVLLAAPTLAITPRDIESPRPNSWVRDAAGMLDAAAIANIDARIEAARASRPVELAVVTVADIGSADPRTFATDLFNHWRIGDSQRNDGVLVFIAREQRAAEIILGAGVDGDNEVAFSQRVMDGVLLPRLRNGDPAGGLLASVDALLQGIHGIALPVVEAVAVPAQTLAGPLEQATPASAPASSGTPLLTRVSVAVGGFLMVAFAFVLRWWWRIRGRRCPRCHAPMQRLGEVEDDQHLQPPQRLEESLGSVDYDVWACSACTFVDTRRYGAWFSRYSRCMQCSTVALKREQTTLVHATYDHGGRVRVDEHCQHCQHRHSYERSTAKKTRSSGGGRSSGFSGGRSSGRGASGRW